MRYAAVDNAKLVLIFLVVLGHLIETVMHGNPLLYGAFNFIYSFHMPAFVMVAGMFFRAEGNIAKTYANVIVPFLVYTLVYEVMFGVASGGLSNYVTRLAPVWIMWFLYSLAIWRLVTPLVLKLKWPFVSAIIVAVFALSIDLFGYPLGIARTLTFFPFFLAGHLYKDALLEKIFTPNQRWIGVISFLISGVCIALFTVDHQIWYGSYNMPDLGYTWVSGVVVKFVTLILGFMMTLAFFKAIPKTEVAATKWGANTLYVFLGHGIILKVFDYLGLFDASFAYLGNVGFLLFAILLATGITLGLSLDIFKRCNDRVFSASIPKEALSF